MGANLEDDDDENSAKNLPSNAPNARWVLDCPMAMMAHA